MKYSETAKPSTILLQAGLFAAGLVAAVAVLSLV